MSLEQPALAGPVLTSSLATPKRGYECSDCLDYKTVIVVANVAPGVTSVAEKPCHCQGTKEPQT